MQLAILLLLIPLAFSLLAFVVGKKWAPVVSIASGILSIFYFLILLSTYNVKEQYLAFNSSFVWIDSMRAHIHLGLDAASVLPLLLTQLIVCLSTLATFVTGNDRSGSYYGLIGLAHAGLNGFFMAQNPITFYIFFELALIPVYFLVLNFGGSDRRAAVFKFFLYTVFGGLLMLAAILFLQFHMHDHLDLDSWKDFYENKLTSVYQGWLFIAFFIAFAIKSPLFPFHTWQVDLYSQADKPGLMIIAAVMSKMGIFGFIRFDFLFLATLFEWFYYLIPLCLIGVLYGAFIAWRHTDMTKILTYSSLSHMGLMAAGVLTLTNKGVQGGLFAILAHGLAAAGLFYAVDVIQRNTKARSIHDISGIARNNPRFAVYVFVLLLSAVGLPLTCGFIGEFYLIWAVAEFRLYWGFVAALTIVFGAIYMFRFYQNIMFGEVSDNAKSFTRLSLSEDYVFIVLIVLIVALGFFPANWIGLGQYAFEYMNYVPAK